MIPKRENALCDIEDLPKNVLLESNAGVDEIYCEYTEKIYCAFFLNIVKKRKSIISIETEMVPQVCISCFYVIAIKRYLSSSPSQGIEPTNKTVETKVSSTKIQAEENVGQESRVTKMLDVDVPQDKNRNETQFESKLEHPQSQIDINSSEKSSSTGVISMVADQNISVVNMDIDEAIDVQNTNGKMVRVSSVANLSSSSCANSSSTPDADTTETQLAAPNVGDVISQIANPEHKTAILISSGESILLFFAQSGSVCINVLFRSSFV